MRQWTVDGPDQHLMTRREVLIALGIGKAALSRLIADGRFPRGVNIGQAVKPSLRWYGRDIACYLYLVQRLIPGPEEDGDEAEE